jgi:shikimate 5-dehydrogenase
MNITVSTKIFGSFSEKPGNNGAMFFNAAFQKNNIDAIYLPVRCADVHDAIHIMKVMNFQGAAFSKPHKESVMEFLHELDQDAEKIGAVNTVVVRDDKFIGFNTDWFGVYSCFKKLDLKYLYIYGNGGFSKAVQYACNKLNIDCMILNRYDKIPTHTVVFNATPIEIIQDNIIDGRPFTEFGFQIFQEQAKLQYNLYTGLIYE